MTAALEGGEWSAARPGRTLPPEKTWYPFYRRLGGPQGWSGRVGNLVPTGIRSRTTQPVVSRYTDWATRSTKIKQYTIQKYKPHLKCYSKFVFHVINFDMPQRKEPQTLRNKGLRKVRAIVREVVPSWIGRLFLSAYRNIQYCQQHAQNMTTDSKAVNNFFRLFFLSFGVTAPSGPWPLIHDVSRSHTTTHHGR